MSRSFSRLRISTPTVPVRNSRSYSIRPLTLVSKVTYLVHQGLTRDCFATLLTTSHGQFILSVTDRFSCPYARPSPRHHRRPRPRAGSFAADTVAAPPSARAPAIGAAARDSDGHAPPAGAVPPADARGAAPGGGAGARKCWPPHRSLLRPHRHVIRHRAKDARRSRGRSADGRGRLLFCLPVGRSRPGAERPRRARSSRRRSRQARADAHAGNERAVCDPGRSATVRRRTHHCSHDTGRLVRPPRRAAGAHIPGVRVRLPGRAVTPGQTRTRPRGQHGGDVTNDRKPTDRAIDVTIDIDATLEEVWEALTTGEGIAR